MLFLDEVHPLNKQVLAYILHTKYVPGAAPIGSPESVAKPYMDQGSHPDVVYRVWDELGSALPDNCRCVVHGTPALVHPKNGILLAFCCGTAYCLRIPETVLVEALKAGLKTSQKWAGGRVTNAAKDLGPGWVFGAWLPEEIVWCKMSFENFGPEKILGGNDLDAHS